AVMLAGLAIALYEWKIPKRLLMDLERILALLKNATTGDLVVISLLAGVGEELFFRGALQPILAGRFGEPEAILIVAVVFGLVHAISFAYVIAAALISILL